MESERHCPWGPSSLERLDKCPGSLRECEGLEDFESEDASRGTRIHEYASILINGGMVESTDEEGLDVARQIAAFAKTEIEQSCDAPEVHIETRLEYSPTPGEVMYWGTSDLVVVCPDCVRVYDWKTGFKAVEQAQNNLQGAAYALAAMQRFGKPVAIVTFFNPCINQLSSWTFDDPAAIALEIGAIIKTAQMADAPCIAGEEQCRYCRAARAGTCPAHMSVCEAGCNLVEAGGDERVPVAKWSDAALAMWLERLQLASKFLEGEIKPEIIRRAREAGECGGYEVREQSGGRDARDICQAWVMLDGEIKQSDFLECCSLSVSKLKAAYSAALVEAGRFKTKKEAGQRFEELLAGCLQDKPARVCLVRKGEK